MVACWSAVWFVNVVYLGTGGGMISACLRDATQCSSGSDDGPRDIVVWVIGLVANRRHSGVALSKAIAIATSPQTWLRSGVTMSRDYTARHGQ